MRFTDWEEEQRAERERLEQKRKEREERKARMQAQAQKEEDPPEQTAPSLPATTDPKELARAATPAAIQALLDIITDETQSANARVSAANSIIDRGHGKVEQAITATVQNKIDPTDVDELARRMRFLMAMSESKAIEDNRTIDLEPINIEDDTED